MNVWDEPADTTGAELLEDVEAYLSRFVAYPSEHALVAHVLWIAHAHAMGAWYNTPRIAFLSPEPGSGKTRALDVTEPLVPNPVRSANASPAALYRKVAQATELGDPLPTILFDEIDTVFGPKAKDNEDTRGFLNAGYRRGNPALRCSFVGKNVITEELESFAPVALAGLNDLPDTLADRAIMVRMRKRAPNERVEPYRTRLNQSEGNQIRDRLSEWVEPHISQWAATFADFPPGIEDRNADIWEALFVVADTAGGTWPQRVRDAAQALIADRAANSQESFGVKLLRDLYGAFHRNGERVEVESTEHILTYLNGLEESPWADIRGKALDSRSLASRLRKYGVKSQTVRLGAETAKGYKRADLVDSWERYTPDLLTPGHPVLNNVTADTETQNQSDVSLVTDVTCLRAEPTGNEPDPAVQTLIDTFGGEVIATE